MMRAYIELVRPHQWLKNLMLLFPPFLAGGIASVNLVTVVTALSAFCLASSAIYVLNDLCDIDQDRCHPRKKLRPIASGMISPFDAGVMGVLLCLGGLVLGAFVSWVFFIYLVAYLIISSAYSLKLKNVPLVEMFCIVSGFLLRLVSGGEAFSIYISDWLFLSVFLLSLFLVCGKRLSEFKHEEGAVPVSVRPVLALYPEGFIEGGMFMSGAAVLMTYTMYALTHGILVYSVPLCCFGLLRYVFRVKAGSGGDPTRALLRDRQLFLVSLAWVIFTAFSIYGT